MEQLNKGESPQKTNNLKKKIFIGIATALIVAISFTLGFFTKIWTTPEKEKTVAWVVSMIDGHYYSEEDGKVKEFTAEDYVQAIVDTLLDRYSDYYTTDEYSDLLQTNKGNNFGFGVKFLKSQTDTTLYGVVGNSPVDKAGLMEGDKITAGKTENGERINFSSKAELLAFTDSILENQTITLYYTRGESAEKSAVVTKSVFVTSYVKYYDKTTTGGFYSQGKDEPTFSMLPSNSMSSLPQDTAYISLSEFHGSAFSQMKRALEFMKSQGKTKLIFDLKNNGGGNMNVLCDIASLFVKEDNSLIAYAKYKDGDSKEFRIGKSNYFDNISKIVVLANGNTASASECLIGAIKYYNSAFSYDNLIIEKNSSGIAKTYGKGVMQTTYSRFGVEDAIKVTTAIIYQPDKTTTINGVGFIAKDSCVAEVNNALSKAISII
ncbi:MAG: hypothetical protein IJY57_00695 [Clostridia bacterium]|nr:hypothetical protein [Clostridia bacterium]